MIGNQNIFCHSSGYDTGDAKASTRRGQPHGQVNTEAKGGGEERYREIE